MTLVVDGGKSKTAVALADHAGRIVASATGPGLPIIAEPGGRAGVAAGLSAALAPLGAACAGLGTAVFGLNGVHAPSLETDLAADVLRGAVDADRLVVASDAVLSYVGAFGTRPGVVVTAGTGSVVLALGADGRAHRVDGDGPLLGDRGSGYAIGLAGLREAMRVADGLAGSQALAGELRQEYGVADEAVRTIHASASPTRLIASFSRNVARAAERGSTTARLIWADAGAELARAALAAAERAGIDTGSFEVAYAGGLFGAGELLRVPLEQELARIAPSAVLQKARGDAIAGGIALAAEPEPVLTRISTWVGATGERLR
jgi:N-acetylglucosamine kinase-like BadF-type ATPase